MKAGMVCILVFAGGIGLAQTNDVVSRVRSSISTVVSSLPRGLWGRPSQIREFGTNPSGFAGYHDLVGIVSNNQDFVCANFSACATNEISRMMLLSAWWGGDDALFINGLSRCLDMVMAGRLPREDLTWYRFGHGIETRSCILSLRYDDPGVSNLVMRLCTYTGETNYCRKVLSGEARQSDLQYFEDMSH